MTSEVSRVPLKGKTPEIARPYDFKPGYGHNATTKLTSISYSSRLHWDSLVSGQWLEYAEIFWIKWKRRRAFMV